MGAFVERQVVTGLFVIPLFALFVRRLHDQDRSGWWAMLLAAFVALHLYDLTTNMSVDHDYVVWKDALPAPLTWLGIFIGLAIFALLVAPETIGANRYGPDPREET